MLQMNRMTSIDLFNLSGHFEFVDHGDLETNIAFYATKMRLEKAEQT